MDNISQLAEIVYQDNKKKGFWETRLALISQGQEYATFVWLANIGLIHSEECEAVVGNLNGSMDEHLPTLKSETVESADAIIRCLDMLGALQAHLNVDRPTPTLDQKLVFAAINEIMEWPSELPSAEVYIQLYELARKQDLANLHHRSTFAELLLQKMNLVMFSTSSSRSNIAQAIVAKLEYNRSRPHKHGKLS